MDSLLVAFANAPDEQEAAAVAGEICNTCDSLMTCLQPFIDLLQSSPVSDQKLRGLFMVCNTLFRYKQGETLSRLLHSGIGKANTLDPHHPLLGSFYGTLSSTHKFRNVLDSALYYANLTEEEFRFHKNESKYWNPPYLRYMIFLELHDFQKADFYIRQAYELVRNSPNRADKGFVLYSLLQAIDNRGTKEEFDFYMDEFIRFKGIGTTNALDARHLGLLEFFDDSEESLAILEQRIKIVMADTARFVHDITHIVLAEKYLAVGKYDLALDQLDQITEISNPSVTAQKSRYRLYYMVYKEMKKPEDAYRAVEQYLTLQDSSYQQILNLKIAEYEVRFQTQEKEREIVDKDLQLTRSKLVQGSYLGISGLLGISLAAGLFFHRRKLNYQRNMNIKEAELQTQRIRELEQKNILLSLNSIIEGQEAERLRIAQDLHDGLGGLLTTVKAHFNSIQHEIENIKNLNVYDKTNQLIDEACMEVRRIAHDMVPYSIKISGISGALEDLRQSIIARGPQCELEIHQLQENLISEQKSNMIYRIIQEITNNAIKHAQATKIFIQLMQHEKTLHILVEDNGKGFDINQVVSNKGMGLKSIDSRVNFLGGKINYDTAPGQGTTVNIDVPLE